MGTSTEMVNDGVLMGLRHPVVKNPRSVESSMQSAVRFFVGASRLALQGLGVAVLMGIVFGLLIGVGGLLLGVEADQRLVIGGASGWLSGLIAMIFVFLQLRRERNMDR